MVDLRAGNLQSNMDIRDLGLLPNIDHDVIKRMLDRQFLEMGSGKNLLEQSLYVRHVRVAPEVCHEHEAAVLQVVSEPNDFLTRQRHRPGRAREKKGIVRQ